MTSEPGPAELERSLRDLAEDLREHFRRRLHASEVAEQVLAETLLRATRRSADLPTDPDCRRLWLFTIAANVLADRHHSTRLRKPWPGRGPGAAEDGDAVTDALRLHTAQRELLLLIDRSGLGIVEAARLLGLSTTSGGSSYAAAREHLRQSLVAAARRPSAE